MLLAKLKQLKKELKDFGFSTFYKMRIDEFIYKSNFNKFGINYPDGQSTNEAVKKQSVNKDSNKNQAVGYYYLKKGLFSTGLNYSNICLLDIGCGYGRAINFGMFLKFKKVIGIDLDHSVIERALTNCYKMQKNGYATQFDVQEVDAAKYSIPEGVNIVFMFNPFGRKTMEDVFKNIRRYCQNSSKELYLIYCKPVHQQVFDAEKDCVKIYEAFNKARTKSEMAVFKIIPQLLQAV